MPRRTKITELFETGAKAEEAAAEPPVAEAAEPPVEAAEPAGERRRKYTYSEKERAARPERLSKARDTAQRNREARMRIDQEVTAAHPRAPDIVIELARLRRYEDMGLATAANRKRLREIRALLEGQALNTPPPALDARAPDVPKPAPAAPPSAPAARTSAATDVEELPPALQTLLATTANIEKTQRQLIGAMAAAEQAKEARRKAKAKAAAPPAPEQPTKPPTASSAAAPPQAKKEEPAPAVKPGPAPNLLQWI